MNTKIEPQISPVPSLKLTSPSLQNEANNSLKSNIKHQTKKIFIIAVGLLILFLGLFLLRFHGTIPLQKDSEKYFKAGVLQGYSRVAVNTDGVQIETCLQSTPFPFNGPNQTITSISSRWHGEMILWLITIWALGLGCAGIMLLRTWDQGWAVKRNSFLCLILPLLALGWFSLQERASQKKLRCVANLYELRHGGEYLYALDNQGRLPKSIFDLEDYVQTYELTCPEDHARSDTGERHTSYSYCHTSDSPENEKPEICCSIHRDCRINADGDIVIDEVKK